jgi:hypothetical protein
MGHLRFEQGRLTELEEALAGAFAMGPKLPAVRAHVALLHCESGRTDEARQALHGLCDQLADWPHEGSWTRVFGLAAMVSAHVHDEVSAQRLYDMFAPYAGQFAASGVLVFGAIDFYLGLLASTLGRFDEALSHFGAAGRMHERISSPPWIARTRLEWGRMLLRRDGPGDVERGRALINAALTMALSLGQGSVERRARDALQV